MRLIIATGIYPPDIGGPATYSKEIAEEFAKRGWEVDVLTYTNLRECERESTRTEGTAAEESFKVIRVSRAHNIFTRYFLYTWKLIKLTRKADLIYAQGPVSEGLPAYLASKITGKKYILKIVGDPAWERLLSVKQKSKKIKQWKTENKNLEIGKLGNWGIGEFVDLEKFQGMKGLPLKIKILRWIERLVSKNAEKIITPSEYLKKIVMTWGMDFEKIQVIFNSIDDTKDEISVNKEEIRNWKFPPGACLRRQADQPLAEEIRNLGGDIILSVGRLVPWKGFDLLIDIMPELLSINPNFKLVIAGDGTEYERLKFQISNFKFQKLDGRIIVTGKLEHQEILDLMRMSKIFVLNSGYEGLSHVIIEAMQAGLSCAVSNKGGNPELVEDGKTGLLFEYNNKEQIFNAIMRLWQDKELRSRVVGGGCEKVKGFGFERMVEETMRIVSSI